MHKSFIYTVVFSVFLSMSFLEGIAQTKGLYIDMRNGRSYELISIGQQLWMAQNINYEVSGGSWCYEDNEDNCDELGRLYTWEAAKQACPDGWHLPTEEEWETLGEEVGGFGQDANQAYDALIDQGPTEFNIKLVGFRTMLRNNTEGYQGNGSQTYFWTSSTYFSDQLAPCYYAFERYYSVSQDVQPKTSGFSVRCLSD